jgi:hypothetical protein
MQKFFKGGFQGGSKTRGSQEPELLIWNTLQSEVIYNSDMDEGYTAFAKEEGQLMEYTTLVEENVCAASSNVVICHYLSDYLPTIAYYIERSKRKKTTSHCKQTLNTLKNGQIHGARNSTLRNVFQRHFLNFSSGSPVLRQPFYKHCLRGCSILGHLRFGVLNMDCPVLLVVCVF